MKKYFLSPLILLSLFYSTYSQTDTLGKYDEPIFILDSVSSNLRLDKYIYSYYDSSQSFSFDQIANIEFAKQNFKNTRAYNIKRKYFWIRASIINKIEYKNNWYLFHYPYFHVSVYQQIGDSILPIKRMGRNIPFWDKDFLLYPHLCRIYLPTDTLTTIFIKTKTDDTPEDVFDFTLRNPDSYHDQYREKASLILLLVGILAVMAIYNLILYHFIRDKSYLYYSISILFLGVYFLSLHTVINGDLVGISAIIGINLFIGFSRYYMNAPTLFPKWNKFLNILHLLYIPAIFVEIPRFIFLFEGFMKFYIYSNLLHLTTIITLVAFSIKAIRSNYKPAVYYFVSSLFFFLFLVFFLSFIIKDPASPNYLALSYIIYGAIAQVVLFSLALAARFNLLRKELSQQQLTNERNEKQKLIEIQQLTEKKNIELELRVVERTKDVVEQNKVLEQQKEEILTQTEELITVNNKLVKLDKFKEMMTGMVIHDLKNPLSSIIGLSNQRQSERNMLLIKQSGKQMLNLVMNILDVQKFENAQVRINCETIPLAVLIKKSLDEITLLAEEKNIEFSITGNQSVSVFVDVGLVERVFTNILSNALKYSDNNAKIIIHIEELPEKPDIKISITDFGSGIEPDKISRVFDKFAQVESQRVGSLRSTGLGLAFCKMVIEAHRCEIGVDSVPNSFTKFWFTLTKSKEQESFESTEYLMMQEKSIMQFSKGEIDYLQPFVSQIRNHKNYESGKILPILSSVNELFSPLVEQWKKEMENAVYTNNEKRYRELLVYSVSADTDEHNDTKED